MMLLSQDKCQEIYDYIELVHIEQYVLESSIETLNPEDTQINTIEGYDLSAIELEDRIWLKFGVTLEQFHNQFDPSTATPR